MSAKQGCHETNSFANSSSNKGCSCSYEQCSSSSLFGRRTRTKSKRSSCSCRTQISLCAPNILCVCLFGVRECFRDQQVEKLTKIGFLGCSPGVRGRFLFVSHTPCSFCRTTNKLQKVSCSYEQCPSRFCLFRGNPAAKWSPIDGQSRGRFLNG